MAHIPYLGWPSSVRVIIVMPIYYNVVASDPTLTPD